MRFLADENLNGSLIRAIRSRIPTADLVRVADVGLSGADDPTVLEWAAQNGRLVLTHDVQTMVGFAYDRVSNGMPMPGLIEIPSYTPIPQAVDDLALLIAASRPGECEGRALYFPL